MPASETAGEDEHAGDGGEGERVDDETPAPPPGAWVIAEPPRRAEDESFPGAPSRPFPRGVWVAPAMSARLFGRRGGAPPRRPLPWEQDQPAAAAGGDGALNAGSLPPWAADLGPAAALAVDAGVALVMLGAFITGMAGQSFIGSALVNQVDRGLRFRLLAVFSQATFVPAVALLVSVLVMSVVPAPRPSRWRRPALAVTAGLGVYVGVAALLRACVFLSFAGTSVGLAVGSLLGALAAVPVAAAASAWAAGILTEDDRRRSPGPS